MTDADRPGGSIGSTPLPRRTERQGWDPAAMSRIPETPTERAMKAAVDMEVHAACSTQTIAKARALDGHFLGYDDVVVALENLLDFCELVFVKPDQNDDVIAARAALAKALPAFIGEAA